MVFLRALEFRQGRFVLLQGVVGLTGPLGQQRQIVVRPRLLLGAGILLQGVPERLRRLLVQAVVEQDYAAFRGRQGGCGDPLRLVQGFQGAAVPRVVSGQGEQGGLIVLVFAAASGQGGQQPQRFPPFEGRGGLFAEPLPGGQGLGLAAGGLLATGEGEQRLCLLGQGQAFRQGQLQLLDGGLLVAVGRQGRRQLEAGVGGGNAAPFDVAAEGLAGSLRQACLPLNGAQQEKGALALWRWRVQV